MDPGLLFALAAAAVPVVLLCVVWALLLRAQRRNRVLAEEVSAVRSRLEELERAASTAPPSDTTTREQHTSEYLITTIGPPEVRRTEPERVPVDGRQFASVALGESLVRLVALGHGLRRALSAESRNRIGFEVRREVRRSRRQRKRDLKEARRHLLATQREEDAA